MVSGPSAFKEFSEEPRREAPPAPKLPNSGSMPSPMGKAPPSGAPAGWFSAEAVSPGPAAALSDAPAGLREKGAGLLQSGSESRQRAA